MNTDFRNNIMHMNHHETIQGTTATNQQLNNSRYVYTSLVLMWSCSLDAGVDAHTHTHTRACAHSRIRTGTEALSLGNEARSSQSRWPLFLISKSATRSLNTCLDVTLWILVRRRAWLTVYLVNAEQHRIALNKELGLGLLRPLSMLPSLKVQWHMLEQQQPASIFLKKPQVLSSHCFLEYIYIYFFAFRLIVLGFSFSSLEFLKVIWWMSQFF